jgi:predicted Zn-dependent protease
VLIIRDEQIQIANWDALTIQVIPIAGSSKKWYIHPVGIAYPRILVQEPIPGVSGFKRSGSLTAPMGIFLLIMGSFLLGVLLFLWKGLPLLTDPAAKNMPIYWEKKIGGQIKAETLKQFEKDSLKTRYLNEILNGIRFSASQDSGFGKPEFFVLKNPELNAFAIPGGTIFVHSGALEKLNSLPELLALIGHENGHVQGRHSIRSLSHSLGLLAAFSLIAGDFAGISSQIADMARELQSLSYSRDFEREADEAAFEFLCRNQADVRGLTGLMLALQKETKHAGSQPEILQSHPLTEERLQSAQEKLRSANCISLPVQARMDSLFQLLKNP